MNTTVVEDAIDGCHPVRPAVQMGEQPSWHVECDLTSEGSRAFSKITSRLAPKPSGGTGKQLAVVVEGRVVTAPTVQGVISGSIEISDDEATEQKMTDLAFLLSASPLPFSLEHLTDSSSP